MKKRILIFSVVFTILSLTAFGLINHNLSTIQPLESYNNEDVAVNSNAMDKINNRIFTDFIYDIGPRFKGITTEDLVGLRSYGDLIGQAHRQRIVSYKSVSVSFLDSDRPIEIKVNSDNGMFSEAQIELIRSANYSNNISIRADYEEKWPEADFVEESHWTNQLTVIPAIQAEYEGGKEALIAYLQKYSKASRVGVKADDLQPAKLFFTVSKEGLIKNVKLDRTSNYPKVDQTMIDIIGKAPGKWLPAQNSKGDKVDQELVVSFGLMGC